MIISEFLYADECDNLIEYMKVLNRMENIPEIFFNQLKKS